MRYSNSLALLGLALVVAGCSSEAGSDGAAPAPAPVQNNAPVAQSANVSGNEDTVISGTLVATDADGDELSYARISNPANGTVSVNTNGSFSYTPRANFNGNDSFTFGASDGTEVSNVATISISIAAVNDAPTASPAVFATQTGNPVSGQLAGSDIDGDTITFGVASAPSNGTVAVNSDGSFTYNPAGGFVGVDRFTFTTNDGAASSAAAEVRINVNGAPNAAPTAQNLSVSGAEDTAIAGQVTATDSDGDAVSFTATSMPANGTLTFSADGSFSYMPAADFNGSDAFTFTASDGAASSNTATVMITVSAESDAPVAENSSESTSNRQVLNSNAVATDGDGDTLSYTLKASVLNGSLTFNSDGSFSYTPNAGFVGNDRFRFSASDASSESNTATVLIMVTANAAPVANDTAVSGDEDAASILGTVTGSDADGDALTFSKASDPANGTVAVNADGTFSYMPNANYNGDDTFTVVANDGAVDSVAATVTVTVNSVNDAPLATTPDAPFEAVAGVTLMGQLEGSDAADGDPDGDNLTFAVVTQPINGTLVLNQNDGTFSYTANETFSGNDSFEFKVNDGSADSASATVSITVAAAPNKKPVANDAAESGEEDGDPVTGTVTATDPDGDDSELTFALATAPPAEDGVLSFADTGEFSFTPIANYNGDTSFTFTASDGEDSSDPATVTITINPVNDRPEANPADYSATTEVALADQLTGSDAADGDSAGDMLTFNLKADVVNGELMLMADGSFTYTSDAGFVGNDAFSFSVTDPEGSESADAEVTISVTAPEADPAESYDVTIASDAPGVPTSIHFTVHEPDGVNNGGTFPLVLEGHGYGGSRVTAANRESGRLLGLLQRGYGVISIDQRGFGQARQSGSTIRLFDPDREGRDLIKILDWADGSLEGEAGLPWLAKVGDNMLLGAIGGSYGGGYQHTILALDAKKRMDAIAPEITWHDLRYSLFSGVMPADPAPEPPADQQLNSTGVFKSYWAGLLSAAGNGLGTQDPQVNQGLSQGLAANSLSEENLALLYQVSLISHCEGNNDFTAGGDPNADPVVPPGDFTAVPALYWQSTRDTLFNMNDMVDNVKCLAALGADVRMLTKINGHDGGDGEQCGGVDKVRSIRDWFDEKLKGVAGKADYIPEFCFTLGESGNDDAVVVDSLPVGGEVVPTVGVEGFVASDASSGGAESLLLKTIAAGGEVIAGIPTATVEIADPTPGGAELGDPIIFLGLGVRKPGETNDTLFMANQVRPVRGYGVKEIELVGVNLRLEAGDELRLLVYPSFPSRYPNSGSQSPTPVNISATVRLPLHAPNLPAPPTN